MKKHLSQNENIDFIEINIFGFVMLKMELTERLSFDLILLDRA